jgi:hypothetical protein
MTLNTHLSIVESNRARRREGRDELVGQPSGDETPAGRFGRLRVLVEALPLTGTELGTDRAIPANWLWRDGILLHLLHREAHAPFRESLPELPAEVFAKPR